MREYTAEEVKRYNIDLKNLEIAWSMFSEQELNGTVAEPHPALAIAEASKLLLSDAGYRGDSKLISFGAAMFRFGQFCSKNGLHESSMQPCICGEVDESELDQWLKHS